MYAALLLICRSNKFLTDETKFGFGSSSLFISFMYVHFMIAFVEFNCDIDEYDGSGHVSDDEEDTN